MMRTRGFTLVEMMVYILLSGIVMASVYGLLIGQSRSYGKQRELTDVHETIRGAAALLAWEIRQVSAGDADLYATGANSITLRSVQGAGIVCAIHGTLPRAGLGRTWGDIDATADDSAMVYAADIDAWRVGPIDQLWTPAAGGVPWCDWGGGGSISPDIVLELTVYGSWTAQQFTDFCNTLSGAPQANCLAATDWPTHCAGLPPGQQTKCNAALAASGGGTFEVGAPLRAFRRIEYGLYQEGGRWWLGRKVGTALSYEKLTGPLRSAVGGGLVFTYYDAAGAVTADPTQVAAVEFIIRAESYRLPDAKGGYQVDTLATRVAVRG